MFNKADYYTQQWWALQDSVLSAAKGRCVDCEWMAVVAHHTSYADGILCDPRYLVALCDGCHKVRHGLSNRRREPYTQYMARRGYRQVSKHDRWTMCEMPYYWQRTDWQPAITPKGT